MWRRLWDGDEGLSVGAEGEGSTRTTAPAWAGLIARPEFRTAVHQNAERILAQMDRTSPIGRWLTNDIGRTTSLSSRILTHDGAGETISVAYLQAIARRRGTSSPGRVLQVIDRARSAGWLGVEAGEGDWKRRRLIALGPFIQVWRERAFIEIESTALLAPHIRPALARLADDAFLLAFLRALSRFDGMAPEVRGPANPSIRLFLSHEGGLRMLYDLLGRQAADRGRLLEGAPLSRLRLARRLNVSRPHVTRLFAEAAAAGHLSLPRRDWVDFSQAMSREAERHFALTFHVVATAATAALETPA